MLEHSSISSLLTVPPDARRRCLYHIDHRTMSPISTARLMLGAREVYLVSDQACSILYQRLVVAGHLETSRRDLKPETPFLPADTAAAYKNACQLSRQGEFVSILPTVTVAMIQDRHCRLFACSGWTRRQSKATSVPTCHVACSQSRAMYRISSYPRTRHHGCRLTSHRDFVRGSHNLEVGRSTLRTQVGDDEIL